MADFKMLASQVENTRKLHAVEAERARLIQEKKATEISDKFAEQDGKFESLMKSLKEELEEIWMMRKDDQARDATLASLQEQLKATQAELTLQGASLTAIELKADKEALAALTARVVALQKGMDAQSAVLNKSIDGQKTALDVLRAETTNAAQVSDLKIMSSNLAAAQERLTDQDVKLQSVTEALKTMLEERAAELEASLAQVKVQVEAAAVPPVAGATKTALPITAESVLKAFNSPFEQTTDAMQEAVRARVAEKMKRFKAASASS